MMHGLEKIVIEVLRFPELYRYLVTNHSIFLWFATLRYAKRVSF